MLKRRGLMIVALCAGVTVVLGACARGSVETIAGEAANPSPRVVGSWASIPTNRLANWSDDAVVGVVTAITEARWNQASGEPWEEADDEPVAWLYRDATVRVEELLWASEKLPVAKGEDVVVRLYGDGTASGYEMEGVAGIRYANERSGPVELGATVLFVLMREAFNMREGPVNAVVLVNGFQGNWTLRGGKAVSADPERTVPADALIRRLKAERARGIDPNDRRGVRDPLEESQPPPAE